MALGPVAVRPTSTAPRTSVGAVIRWLCAVVAGAVVSGFTFLLLTGQYINDGPVIVTLGRGHGLHAGDLFVIAGWAVAMLAVLSLALMPGRDGHRRDAPGATTGRAADAPGRYGRPQ
jgi:hypothetical protein